MERTRATLEVHSEKLDSLNNQLIEAGLKTPSESSDGEDDASSSKASFEAEMETGEAQEGGRRSRRRRPLSRWMME